MASLVLGGIGAAIGSSIGGTILGMSATSIGWSIGSTLGSVLFAPKGQDIQGPRLNDKSVSASAYGNIRPKIYGTYRVGAEIIWSTDLKEHKHTEEAGKGGGGGGSYTTYTYSVSFAAALCAGPIEGVRKIWLDSKLIYTQAEDATKKELQASDKMAKRIAIYTGTETQTADPVIEATLGSGNVPAYRGTAYMVFENLDVTKYGNRIPVITVEVVASGSEGYVENVPSPITDAGIRQSIFVGNGVVKAYYYGYTYSASDSETLKKFQQRVIDFDGTVKRTKTRSIVGSSGSYTFFYPYSQSPDMDFVLGLVSADGGVSSYYLAWYADNPYSYQGILTDVGNCKNYRNGTDFSYNIIWQDATTFYLYKSNSGQLFKYQMRLLIGILGEVWNLKLLWECQVDERREGTDPNGHHGTFALDHATGETYCQIDTYTGTQSCVRRVSNDGEIIETKFTVTGVQTNGSMAFDNGLLWVQSGYAMQTWDWEIETQLNSASITSSISTGKWVWDAVGNLVVVMVAGEIYTVSRTLTRNPAALDDVVTDLCETAGVAIADIDATDLSSDTVRGFMVAQQGQARAALEQLAAAYFFDCVDSGNELRFVKRGGAVAATIADTDLGCYDEAESPAQLAMATRTQEEELPKAITLLYANYDADYQQGGQHSLRQSVLAGTEVTVQAPLAMTDSEGKTIADTLMFSSWHNRHQFTLRTWLKYAAVEPCDVISARGETLRVTSRAEGVNGIVELQAVRELPAIYTGQVGSAAVSGYSNQSVTVAGLTDFELLDIPNLRDEDYLAYGIYWAASGVLDDWSGATFLKSSDSGDTWTALGLNDTATVMGSCSTTLGDFTGGNIFDETNILRVSVNSTLESKTWDQVLSGANVALVGDEIIQFRTASLVSTGVYDLSGLLRGRRGTEAEMSTHGADERFVMLTTSAIRFTPLQSTDYNTQRLYGALTFGDTILDIETENLTYAGNNMQPFSPVHPSAGIDESGNIDLAWVRRVTMDGFWVDSRDAGTGMPSASYNLYIYSDSGFTTLLRSQAGLTSASYTYTVADRTTDSNLGDYTYFKVQEVNSGIGSDFLEASLRHNLITIANSYMTEALALSPVAAWKFDETSGTSAADATGNGHTGTYTGGFTLAQDALVTSSAGEYSVELDGSTGYITVPDSASWEGAFTFVCMIHPTAAAHDGIFHHGDTTVGGQQGKYCSRNANGTIYFRWFNGAWRELTTSIVANLNETSFLSIRYDGGTSLKVNINAVSETRTMANAILTSAQALIIGGLKGGTVGSTFAGKLDDAVWFDRYLTDGEIYTLRT